MLPSLQTLLYLGNNLKVYFTTTLSTHNWFVVDNGKLSEEQTCSGDALCLGSNRKPGTWMNVRENLIRAPTALIEASSYEFSDDILVNRVGRGGVADR